MTQVLEIVCSCISHGAQGTVELMMERRSCGHVSANHFILERHGFFIFLLGGCSCGIVYTRCVWWRPHRASSHRTGRFGGQGHVTHIYRVQGLPGLLEGPLRHFVHVAYLMTAGVEPILTENSDLWARDVSDSV